MYGKVCYHDILQTTCGNFAKFTRWYSWGQRCTDLIVRSKVQKSRLQRDGYKHFERRILQTTGGNFIGFTTSVQLVTKMNRFDFEVSKSKVKIAAKFSGGGIRIDGLPSNTI